MKDVEVSLDLDIAISASRLSHLGLITVQFAINVSWKWIIIVLGLEIVWVCTII